MVKVECRYDEETKMNPNDLLLSMFANISSPSPQGIESQEHTTADYTESLLRTLLSKPTSEQAKENVSVKLEDQHSSQDLPTLTTLNPTLANALSGIMSRRVEEIKTFGLPVPLAKADPIERAYPNVSLQRRRSGPVTLEGPVVPLHLQKHAGEVFDLPSCHVVNYNGHQASVPDEIRCHLCNFPMKMCYRKSKYKQEIREYPAYRCLRKGCQTFRAIRKILEPETIPAVSAKRKQDGHDQILRNILSAPVSQSTNEQPFPKIKKEEHEGTLIYVPVSLNPAQIAKLRQTAWDILQADGLMESSSSAPLVIPTALSEEVFREKMTTEAGMQEIRRQFQEAEEVEVKEA